jgi:hypothetical protein
MNLRNVNPKLGVLAPIVIGAVLLASFHSVAKANPSESYGHKQMYQEKMREHMKVRLDKLAERLEIKASQQAVWEEFAKSVEMLADRNVKKPNDDADAATISRYRAERAADLANKLSKIADATAKLQTALTSDQRKILDQTAQRFLHHDRGINHTSRRMDRDSSGHGWDQLGNDAS